MAALTDHQVAETLGAMLSQGSPISRRRLGEAISFLRLVLRLLLRHPLYRLVKLALILARASLPRGLDEALTLVAVIWRGGCLAGHVAILPHRAKNGDRPVDPCFSFPP